MPSNVGPTSNRIFWEAVYQSCSCGRYLSPAMIRRIPGVFLNKARHQQTRMLDLRGGSEQLAYGP